jgi:ankyrin repeat protein
MKKNIYVLLILSIIFSQWIFSAATIHEATKDGDLKSVIALLEKNPHLLNQQDANNKTALHIACRYGKDDVAKYLLKKGADVDVKDETNATALHYASALGNLEMVKALIKSKTKALHWGAKWENTPLHLACERGHPEVVKLLLDKGADIEARNGYKRTPIICAARESGNLEVVKILVGRGAKINAADLSDDTALTLAAWRGFKDLVNYLIDKNSQASAKQLKSLLWMAAEHNLGRLYDYVMKNGLKIEKENKEFRTLIHSAAAGGSMEMVSSLIKMGFNPQHQDENGWAPIHYAASQGKVKMLEYLIQKTGVDKNSRNIKGETAYHLAVFREFPQAAQFLRSIGVDTSEPKFPKLSGPYMGQKPPGDRPKMFLPGIVSGHYHAHSAVVFSPDGKEACWTEMYPPREKGYGTGGVMVMRMTNGKSWTYPQLSKVMEGECFFSPDGNRLYFISTKPIAKGDRGGKENIWFMEKTVSGWSKAKPVDDAVNSMNLHWTFSLDKKGNLYFSSNGIFYAENKNGTFQKPVDISILYNNKTLKGFCPYISPDGNYLLFSSREEGERNIDLYVSFKKKDGSWTDRINLGKEVNATSHDIAAFVTADGKYLFFTSVGKNRPWGIYWVDAKVIENLKPKDLR